MSRLRLDHYPSGVPGYFSSGAITPKATRLGVAELGREVSTADISHGRRWRLGWLWVTGNADFSSCPAWDDRVGRVRSSRRSVCVHLAGKFRQSETDVTSPEMADVGSRGGASNSVVGHIPHMEQDAVT